MKDKDQPLTEQEKTLLRQMVGSLNWVVRATRPDLSYDLIDLSTRFNNGTVEDLKRARKCLGNLKQNRADIKIPNLIKLSSTDIFCFTDAAMGNLNNKVDSCGGYVIFLVNKNNGLCAPIEWKANKVQRVVLSSLAAETLSLYDGLDAALGIRNLLQNLLGNYGEDIKVVAFVDNKSLTEAIYSMTAVSEVRLRREIAVIKEMIRSGGVRMIKWIPGQSQLANVLTKKGQSGADLLQVLQEGRMSLN